jgi:hypothetical protein
MIWFNLCRIVPAGYPHGAAFDEVLESLRCAIEALGHGVNLVRNAVGSRGINVVLGAHLLEDDGARALPPETIVYNFEQIDSGSSWLRPAFLAALGRCVVWDYSRRNLERIRALTGNPRLVYVPVGYVPQLTRISADVPQDIDVLFYGAMNDRRQRVIDALRAGGLEVCAVFGTYGAVRDRLIARAKVVLNVHYYDASVFEIVRASYLLANRKAVVAECHGGTEIYADLRDAMRLVPYDDLVASCRELVGDPALRARYADAGFRRMSARRAVDLLRPAVTAAATAHAIREAQGPTTDPDR